MKIVIIVIITIILAAIIGFIGFLLFSSYNLNQLQKMSTKDIIKYSTEDRKDAVITVGTYKNGQFSYTVYGQNGAILPQKEYTYEIGSLTKTFTASLFSKAIVEGKISLEDTIDKYIELPKGKDYPTLARLLTHTSGYKPYYMEWQMIPNHLKGKNEFYHIGKELIINRVKSIKLENKDYPFSYSNFGYAVLGIVLESIYQESYTDLMNNYIQQELGLENTIIKNEAIDLENSWDWAENDAYISAGALLSNITDMLKYAKMQLDNQPDYLSYGHGAIKNIDNSNKVYEKMDINMNSIGMAWLQDTKNNFIWHNGGTGEYNCYLGINKENNTAVVVLSNLPPDYKIPATVIGIRILQEMK